MDCDRICVIVDWIAKKNEKNFLYLTDKHYFCRTKTATYGLILY